MATRTEVKKMAKEKLRTALYGRLTSCAELEEIAEDYPELNEEERNEVEQEIYKQIDRLAKHL